MSLPSPLKNAALAAAGAALVGGGMLVGFMSAMARRKQLGEAAPAIPVPDPAMTKRVDDVARSVAELQKRLDSASPPAEAVADRLDTVSRRVEQLEQRVQQLVSEAPAVPPVDQILAAVEHMVTTRIAGLDERLTDQVHAIDLLRTASTQTDSLLQKLIQAVESLAAQTLEKGEGELPRPRDYPVA